MSSLQAIRFLVVDDFTSMRQIVKQILNQRGFNDVTLADDGAKVLSMLKEGDFGFLITDWNMPQMEGIDLIKAVRADNRIGKLPILMVTAEAKREHIIEAAQAGVNDYVIKPFTPDTLISKVEKVLKAVGAMQ